MSAEQEPTGIPTRAIHEAYLDVQRALKKYRQATDNSSQNQVERAHGEVQDAVLTLYEMLRPHIRQNNAVDGYWEGEPPSYSSAESGQAPDPDDGTAILAWQVHPRSVELNGTNPGEIGSRREWHDALDLPDTVRLTSVAANNGQVLVRYHTYEMGLHQLDDWKTDFETVQADLGGFMGGREKRETVRQRVPIEKLRRAARALNDVANDLGFLSHTETPVISDPDPI